VGDAVGGDVVAERMTLASFLDRLGLEDTPTRACIRSAFVLGVGMKSVPSATETLRNVAAYHDGAIGFKEFCDRLALWLVALERYDLERAAHCMLFGHPEPDPELW
jgi:hypothetical protein